MSFLTRVKTENFDIGWRKHEWLMVIGLLSYDVEMGIKKFKSFFWFSRFAFGCSMNGWCHATCRSYMFLTKKKLWNIYDIRIVGGKVALIPVVSSNDTTYSNVVSIPAENTTNIYMSYITTYPLSGACVFNAARTMMYMLRERIHILSKRPQDISRSPRPRCTVMTSRTTDTQPLPHDRDCPQANLILRGWILTFLPCRRCVVTESKSLLACHMLILL
jgi:hypothetical protein